MWKHFCCTVLVGGVRVFIFVIGVVVLPPYGVLLKCTQNYTAMCTLYKRIDYTDCLLIEFDHCHLYKSIIYTQQ